MESIPAVLWLEDGVIMCVVEVGEVPRLVIMAFVMAFDGGSSIT